MFLNHRILQAEYFDEPDRPAAELADGYRMLGEMNRFFVLSEPFKRLLPNWLGAERCRSLSFLDVGGGDGSLGEELRNWAAGRNWDWRFTTLDLNPRALRLNPAGRFVAGSAVALPFYDGSFDVVVSSQMAHHLPDEQAVCQHFRESWRVARELVFLNDVHRNILLFAIVWLALWLKRYPAHFRSDGLISVRRGWRVKEWRELAARAGIPDARVTLYAVARVMLHARKPPVSPHC